MNRALWIVVVLSASIATLVAIAERANLEAAAIAATVAVLVAAFGLWQTLPTTEPTVAATAHPRPGAIVGVRSWFDGGRYGRVEIVGLLDRLERAAGHSDLPFRSSDEAARIARLPTEQFRRYVDGRLGEIEKGP